MSNQKLLCQAEISESSLRNQEKEKEKKRKREKEKQRNRETEKQRKREKEKQRKRETEKEKADSQFETEVTAREGRSLTYSHALTHIKRETTSYL